MQEILKAYHIIQITYRIIGSIIILIACNPIDEAVDLTGTVKKDSVTILIERSKDKLLNEEKRKANLRSAYQFNKLLLNDSIKNRNLLKIAFQAYKINDKAFFKKVNYEALFLSDQLQDTYGIGDAHWNFGNFYVKKELMDSAYIHYYKAYKSFETVNHDYYAGKMLYNMAFIQGRVKDYTGSEISLFKAVSIFKELNKNYNLFLCYDYLRLIYIDLEEYDRAIFYHNKANEYLELSGKKDSNKEKSLNNLSLIYQNQGKHKKAIITIEQALENKNLKKENIGLYARLVDNKSYNRFLLRDTTDLLQDFSKALYLRDSLNNLSGVVVSKIHLAEYHLINNDTIRSIKNLKEAYELAKIINNNRDILTSLKMLSRIDKENSNTHLVNYLTLNDSLQKEERKIRNKFTRIRFETDEYIEETKYLSKQKIWIISIGIFIISTLSFLYYLRRQKAKNKELIFEKEQQKANEEIYSLLLRHQSDLEEGRLQERNRISEDLHDGVLSKLFGTRMAFGFLDLSGKEKDLKKYNSYLHQLQEIETEIRNISHELKSEILSSEFDFIDILDDLIEKQSKVGEFEYKLKNDDVIYWEEINEKVKINLYHIVLEAVQNITKYANASLVNIHFELIGERIRMTIEDNGVGFNLSKKNKGIGLKNMRSRTQKIAGKFELSSILNKGTKITITIPFKIIDHDKKI